MRNQILAVCLAAITISACLEPEWGDVEAARLSFSRQEFPESFDPLNSKTPPTQGFLQPNPSLTLSEIRPELMNDLTIEMVSAITMLGLVPSDLSTQLAEVFEQGINPVASTLPIVSAITPVNSADMTQSFVWYQRFGDVVWVAYKIGWKNSQIGLEGVDLRLQIPFQTESVSSRLMQMQSISISGTNFRNDNSTDLYNLLPNTQDADDVVVERAASIGATVGTVKVGGATVDAGLERLLQAAIQYRTNGIRNPEWPFIKWRSLQMNPDQVAPIALHYEYYSAKGGDTVDLHDSGGFVASNPVTDLPRGKGTFPITLPESYTVRLRGTVSKTITIQ